MKAFADVADSVHGAHKLWGWYLAVGIALILVGLYCIWAEGIATMASVIVLGAALFVAGIVQLAGAVMARGAGHIVLLLLVGILDIIVGLMLLEHPVAGALFVTLLLAVLFVFGGIFRFITALMLQFPHYGWVAFGGVVSVILGVLLWIQWPFSALWFIGFVVGLNFVFAGFSWSMMAWKLKAA
ncbi:MAG: HdeD family acid-resistance protein [Candidatus Cybelea sp.]